jgi:hypothetical protein
VNQSLVPGDVVLLLTIDDNYVDLTLSALGFDADPARSEKTTPASSEDITLEKEQARRLAREHASSTHLA